VATVIFSSAQRRFTNDDQRVEIGASRVDELIAELYARYSALEGLLDHAAVSIDGVIHNDAIYINLDPDVEVHFVGAVGGGSGNSVMESENPFAGDPLGYAQRWIREGRRVALATVIETWGSSPCPPGSQLAVDGDGHFEGSVSGGCVESAVIEETSRVLESGASSVLEFGVADEDAWAVGLACGGRVRIFVERLD
jgi:hypothetical protein